MNRKTLFAVAALLLAVCLVPLSACAKKPAVTYTGVDITKDGVSVNELDVLVGDSVSLAVKADDGTTPAVRWESSNLSVAVIGADGKAEVKSEGTAIVTATESASGKNFSDSIFINAKPKVEQTGVGSGKSADDPIFLGNEGKDEPIEVYFVEMQHIYADSVFIKKGNVEVLIDAGWSCDGTYVSQILTEKCADGRLDAFMVSHSDGDHIDGIANALGGVENVSLMIDYGGVGSGNVKATREKYIPKGMQYHSAYDCANQLNGAQNRYYLTSEFYVDVLNTGEYIMNNESTASNPHSLATLFTYKQFKFLTAGDLTSESEAKLLKNESLPEVTLYKASHHGSHGSNSQAFLNKINPQAVAISAARANNYNDTPKGEHVPQKDKTYNLNAASGHPAAAAIERIYKTPNIAVNLNVYWNAVNGTMKFTSYGGNDFTFSGSTPKKGYYDLTLTDNKAVWDDGINDFKNRVTGEENFRLHETKVFAFRNYIQYLPQWAQNEFYPDYSAK